MKPRNYFVLYLIAIISLQYNGYAHDLFPILEGPYLGQKPPGLVVEKFAPGIISTKQNEVNSVFSPNGNHFYFSIFKPGAGYKIMVTNEQSDGWTKPQPAAFGLEYSEVDPFISPDGNFLFYLSKRPLENNDPRFSGYQIWRLSKIDNRWQEPIRLGKNVNIGHRQLFPTVADNGSLYFNSDKTLYGKGDFYLSRYVDGVYTNAENLGDSINTEYDESDVFVAPDESYLIFTTIDRPDGFGSGDLYISVKNKNGSWTQAVNMGNKINTPFAEFAAVVTPDGKYMMFTSDREGSNDIFWIDIKIIEEFKKGLKNR
jgi:Tol biopolymer transport system component